jgi:hypothetical protein
LEAVAALLPPIVVAAAFVALARAVIRHTDKSGGSAELDRDDDSSGSAGRDARGS